jgi:hydrogenase small subunit
MLISRRQFLKYCSIAAGAMGLTATDLMKLEKATAATGGLPVIWVAGQACTGCEVSLANSVYYATIQEILLLGQASKTLDVKVIDTLMGAFGGGAGNPWDTIQSTVTNDPFALVVVGSIPATDIGTPNDGYCEIGSYNGAASENMGDVVSHLANHANCAAILSVGTCASFGGIPAAAGNVTGAMGAQEYLGGIPKGSLSLYDTITGGWNYTYNRSIRNKLINIPGCPPNPNWIVGTVAYLLANNLKFPALDSLRRPRTYYGQRNCNACDRFANSKSLGQRGGFVGISADANTSAMAVSEPNAIGDPTKNIVGGLCLKKEGCKGSRTKSDCSMRQWHSPGYMQPGVNWCVGAGAPCQGCVQNFFPDGMSPFHYIR